MPIDFHAEENRESYAHRAVDDGWREAMKDIVRLNRMDGQRLADIGCGGGLYAKAWAEMGAAVTAIDFSNAMLQAARQTCRGLENVTFVQGGALYTGLVPRSFDIVFERALLHHITDVNGCLCEAARLLSPGGRVIVQDRTPDDVMLAGSPEHLRGYFFECFPRLYEVELRRRPSNNQVVRELENAGFRGVETRQLSEVRRVYASFSDLAADLRSRTGRSILHELNDVEVEELIAYIGRHFAVDGPIVERDRWTVWTGINQGSSSSQPS